jgi:pimeloyl-ACP methyl ester carboxylesterase
VLRAGSDTGAAVFLIGHSTGAVLALHVAASARAGAIAGLDISGLPFVFDETLADKQQLASLDYLPGNSREFRRALFYGPDETFDADMVAAEERLIRALFTSAPRVELAWQRASGHNISLYHVARAYHLRAIAFFDEALLHA